MYCHIKDKAGTPAANDRESDDHEWCDCHNDSARFRSGRSDDSRTPVSTVEMQHLVEMLLELKEARVLVAQRHLIIITGATAKPLNPKPPKP